MPLGTSITPGRWPAEWRSKDNVPVKEKSMADTTQIPDQEDILAKNQRLEADNTRLR